MHNIKNLASQGRGGDTMLAHINPQEAQLLKSKGGTGTINPNTGLPEYKKFWKRVTPAEIVKAVEKVAAPVVQTAQAIIKNPLPVIETAALISVGVPPSVASAAVTAMNGGSVKQIVSNGLTAYAGSQIAGSVANLLPEGTSAITVKIDSPSSTF